MLRVPDHGVRSADKHDTVYFVSCIDRMRFVRGGRGRSITEMLALC